MTERATDKFSGTNLCSIRYQASVLAESAILAYWMQYRDDDCFALHHKYAIESLHKLADLCGFDLVEKPADTLEDADLRGDMAAARTREMNAELLEVQAAALKLKGSI